MPEINRVSELSNEINERRITINICRFWTDAIIGELCFILRDRTGTRIGGGCLVEIQDKYHEMLVREGYWIDIDNFQVEDDLIAWKTSAHHIQIRLTEDASVGLYATLLKSSMNLSPLIQF